MLGELMEFAIHGAELELGRAGDRRRIVALADAVSSTSTCGQQGVLARISAHFNDSSPRRLLTLARLPCKLDLPLSPPYRTR